MKRPVLIKKAKPVVKLMLDSGVFSAWNRGFELDIKDYIAWVKKYEHLFYSVVGMDKIPGVFGRPRTSAEVEDSAKQSYENQQRMKDAGLKPIPVFHQGERLHWLEKYLEDREPYIGIATSKDVATPSQVRFLDNLFGTYFADTEGRPLVKLHGFGITKPQLLLNYPWYSVDSTTWTLSPGYGQILVPPFRKGKPDYTVPPLKVIMSGVRNESPSAQNRQFERLGQLAQEWVLAYMAEVGVGLTETRYMGIARRRIMLHYYKHLQEALYDVRFKHGRIGQLTGPDHFDTLDWEPIGPWHLNIHYATVLNPEWNQVMTEVGANRRLLNYFDLKDRDPAIMEEFVMTGMQGKYVRKPPPRNDSEGYRNWRRMALFNRHLAYQSMKEEPEA